MTLDFSGQDIVQRRAFKGGKADKKQGMGQLCRREGGYQEKILPSSPQTIMEYHTQSGSEATEAGERFK